MAQSDRGKGTRFDLKPRLRITSLAYLNSFTLPP